MTTRTSSIAIIGSGLAGLSAARSLQERGVRSVVFDKGRGPGGRTSLRRAEPFGFDHGAQYFTVRDARFGEAVEAWRRDGVVAPWEGRIVSLEVGQVQPVREGTERFVGVPGMNAMARRLARDLDLRQGVRVAALDRSASGWNLHDGEGQDLGSFEQVIVTAPPDQAAELVGPHSTLGQRARSARLRPCWAVMLGLEESYGVPFDGAFCHGPALSWVARNSSKPGRTEHEAWVLHAAPDWSEAHLEDEPGAVLDALRGELEHMTGRPMPRTVHADAHRWRYALPDPALEEGCLVEAETGLCLAGDGLHGGRVEGAYLSGLCVADRLLE